MSGFGIWNVVFVLWLHYSHWENCLFQSCNDDELNVEATEFLIVSLANRFKGSSYPFQMSLYLFGYFFFMLMCMSFAFFFEWSLFVFSVSFLWKPIWCYCFWFHVKNISTLFFRCAYLFRFEKCCFEMQVKTWDWKYFEDNNFDTTK